MSWNKLPLAKKVGEVPENEDKFASWSGSHGYYSRPETVSNPFKTDKMINGTFDKTEMVHNLTLCSTQRDINKSQVEFKPSSSHDPRMIVKSTSKAYFVDQRELSRIMQDKGTVENFKISFENICAKGGQIFKEDPSIPVSQVHKAINDCLGVEAPEFITDKFIELCNKNSVAGRITWSRFSDIVSTVVAAVDAECSYRRELPALMVLMNRPRIVDKDLGSLGFAYTKTIEPTNKKGLNNAARILYAGTTKSTHHLPGFKGHIPANVRNNRKLEHSSGADYHPVANNLRLTQRGMGCVLGYTGHVPHETSGPRQERTTACDPRTTNGASFGSTRAFL